MVAKKMFLLRLLLPDDAVTCRFDDRLKNEVQTGAFCFCHTQVSLPVSPFGVCNS